MGRFEPINRRPVLVTKRDGRTVLEGTRAVIHLPLGRLLFGLYLWVQEGTELSDIEFRAVRGSYLAMHHQYPSLEALREHNRAFSLPGGDRLFFCIDGRSALDTSDGFQHMELSFVAAETCRVCVYSIELAEFGRG